MLCTAVGAGKRSIDSGPTAGPRRARSWIARGRGTAGAARLGMNTETTAWLVTSVAGISSGVIAGVQHRVTTSSIVAISAVVAVAAGLLSRILPRDADHAS